MRDQRRLVAPDLVGAQQELGEIHHPGAPAGVLVGAVDADQFAAGRIAAVLDVLRPVTLVLLRVDEPLHFARYPAGLVKLQRADHLLDQALLVFLVENLEALRQAGLAPVQPQQPVREAVEGAHPHRVHGHVQQRLDATAHLAGGLVGERDGKDGLRRNSFLGDQPRNPVHQHPGFAAAGTGQHQQRPRRRRDGFRLRGIHLFE